MECFVVYTDEIQGRLDPPFYKPAYVINEKLISNCKWNAKKLIDITKRIVDGPFGSQLKVEEYKEHGIPLIRVSNVRTGEINGEFVYISEDKQNQLKRSRVLPNDVLLTKAGAILGYSAVFPEHLKEGNITSHLVTITCKPEVLPKYLALFFRTSLGQLQIYRWGNKSTRPELNTAEVGEILIPIPPIELQNRIVQIMDNAYNLKKSRETEAKQLLDSINDYVLSELDIQLPELTDKMTFVIYSDNVKGGRIDPYYYQPKFEEVEKAIEKGKFKARVLKEVADKLLSGQRPKGGVRQISEGIPSLGGEHILSDGTVATTDLKFIPVEFHKKQLKSRVKKKDILIVKDGATTGKVGIIPENYPFEEANINEHVFLLRIKKEINPHFIFSILKSSVGQMQINRDITGGTIMGIIRETTEKIKIPLPPLSIQNKIAEEVKRRMQKAEQLQKEAKEELEKAKQEVEKIILGE